jgi:hypothetical protein
MVLLNTDQAVDFPPFVTDQILKLKKKNLRYSKVFAILCGCRNGSGNWKTSNVIVPMTCSQNSQDLSSQFVERPDEISHDLILVYNFCSSFPASLLSQS